MQIDKNNEVQHSGIIGKAKDWVKGNITGKAAANGGADTPLISEIDDYSGPSSKKMPGIGTCTKAGATLGGAVGGAGGMIYGYAKLKTDGKPEIGPEVVTDILSPKLVGQQDTVTGSAGSYSHHITPVIVDEKVGTYTKPQVIYHSSADPVIGGVAGLVGGTIIGGVVGLVTGVILKIVGAVSGHGEKIAEKDTAENKGEKKSGRSLGGTLGVLGGAAAGAAGGLYLADKTNAVKESYRSNITYRGPVYQTDLIGYTDMDTTNARSEPYTWPPEGQGQAIRRDVAQIAPDGSPKLQPLVENSTVGFQDPMLDKIFLVGLGGIVGAMGAIAINTIIRVVTGGEKAHK